jgi:NADPH:quinone reductase
MRAISYSSLGGADVLTLIDRPMREPGPGEVRVRVHRAGVNPSDWKSRTGGGLRTELTEANVPGQDGSGVIDAVGPGVDAGLIGRRVWLWEVAYQRTEGTAHMPSCPSIRRCRCPTARRSTSGPASASRS